MSNNNFRNAELLGKLERHPLKASLAKILDAAEAFQGDVEYLTLNRDLSPRGLDNARRAKLRAAVRDLRDAKQPIRELEAKLDAKSKAVQMPKFDRSDDYGLKLRMELRQTLKTADPGQRELLLAKSAYADALLETEPEASGFFLAEGFNGTISAEIQRDRDIVAAAKQKRLEGMFGRELEEIAELKEKIDGANMIADLALVDMKLHAGLDDRAFTEFVSPIMNRRNAPWLVRDGATIMRVRPEKIGTPELHQPATSEEIADGVFFKDETAYLAARAA
jgi:hypothetical protein